MAIISLKKENFGKLSDNFSESSESCRDNELNYDGSNKIYKIEEHYNSIEDVILDSE